MRLLLLLVALATSLGVQGSLFPQALPGVCHHGYVGAGCSFDITELDVRGVTINPKRVATNITDCPYYCLLPGAWKLPACLFCETAVDPLNITYGIPNGMNVNYYPYFDHLFYVNATTEIDGFGLMSQREWGTSGIFSSSSKTWKHWVYNYFVHDSMLVVSTRRLPFLQVGWRPGYFPGPTAELAQAVSLLPSTYDADAYAQFIADWGTHFALSVHAGGLLAVKTYINKCFSSKFDKTVVTEKSRDFAVFVSGGTSGHMSNNSLMYNYSSTAVTVLGGRPPKLGNITQYNPMSADDLAAWTASILDNMVPIDMVMEPISSLVKQIDAGKAANLDKAIMAHNATVAASNQDVINQLQPKANRTVPSWCTAPTPPGDDTPSASAAEAVGPQSWASVSRGSRRGHYAAANGTADDDGYDDDDAYDDDEAFDDDDAPIPPVQPKWMTVPGLTTSAGGMGERLGHFFDPLNQMSRGGVVQFTYDNTNHTYVTGVPHKQQRFGVPDAVSIFKTPALDSDVTLQTFTNVSSYESWEASYSGLDLGIIALGDISVTVKALVKGGKSTCFHSRLLMPDSKVVLTPSAILAHELQVGGKMAKEPFARAVQVLTLAHKLGKATPALIRTFLNTYGLYYTSSGFLGGQLDVFVSVSNEVIARGEIDVELSVTAIMINIGIMFDVLDVEAGAGLDMNLQVLGNASLVVVGRGGNPLKLLPIGSSKSWPKSWLPTVAWNPALLTTADSYTPTYALFADAGIRAAVKAQTEAMLNTSSPVNRYGCAMPVGTAMNASEFPFPSSALSAAPRVAPKKMDRVRKVAVAASPSPAPPVPFPLGSLGRTYTLATGEVGASVMTPTYDNHSTTALPWNLPQAPGGAWYGGHALRDGPNAVSIPKAISVCTTPPVCTAGNFSLFLNASAYAEFSAEFMLGFAGMSWLLPGAFLTSVDADIAGQFEGGARVLGVFGMRLPLLEATFGGAAGPQDLTPDMSSALAALPPSPDQAAYAPFFSKHGTHYVRSVMIGAALNITLAFDAKVAASFSKDMGITIGGLSISLLLGVLGAVVVDILEILHIIKHLLSPEVCAQWGANATATVCACGGDVASFADGSSTMEQWLTTINDAPSGLPDSRQLAPLYTLVDNSTVRDAMKSAMMDFLTNTTTSSSSSSFRRGRAAPRPTAAAGKRCSWSSEDLNYCCCWDVKVPLGKATPACNVDSVDELKRVVVDSFRSRTPVG